MEASSRFGYMASNAEFASKIGACWRDFAAGSPMVQRDELNPVVASRSIPRPLPQA
jgi:hypothetical protein